MKAPATLLRRISHAAMLSARAESCSAPARTAIRRRYQQRVYPLTSRDMINARR